MLGPLLTEKVAHAAIRFAKLRRLVTSSQPGVSASERYLAANFDHTRYPHSTTLARDLSGNRCLFFYLSASSPTSSRTRFCCRGAQRLGRTMEVFGKMRRAPGPSARSKVILSGVTAELGAASLPDRNAPRGRGSSITVLHVIRESSASRSAPS